MLFGRELLLKSCCCSGCRGEANRSARYAQSPITLRHVPLTSFSPLRRRARQVRCREGKSVQSSSVQLVLTLHNLQAEQERRAAVIRAEGEAEAAATISSALNKAGEAFVTFRKIEAAKAIVQSLSANQNVSYIPAGGSNGSNGGSGILLNVPAR